MKSMNVRVAMVLGLVAGIVAVGLVVTGNQVSGQLNTIGAGIDPAYRTAPERAARPASPAPAAEEPGQGQGLPLTDDGQQPPSALRDDLRVVYTGSLDLVVADLQAALAQARAAIAATGGYIGASAETNDGDVAVATITYRIPASRWEDAVADLRGLATRVVNERTEATEVGSQLVDLEARLRNLRASETVLVGIAEGTERVADLLEVQGRIADVRGQIEQLDAQRAQLEDQVAYGTLVTTFGTEVVQVQAAAQGWDPRTDVDGATATVIQAGQTLVSGAIWFAIVWLPVIVALVLLALVVRWAVRRLFPNAHPADAIAGWGGGEG